MIHRLKWKKHFAWIAKVTLSKDWCFWYILLGQFHANCNLIELKQIRTSQKPFKNTIKSKYGKFYLTTSPKTLSQFYIYCCLVPTHFTEFLSFFWKTQAALWIASSHFHEGKEISTIPLISTHAFINNCIISKHNIFQTWNTCI